MKFSQYILLTENQVHYISNIDAKEYLKTKCQHTIANDIKLYRGMPSNDEYQIGNAEFNTPRRSANTTNYSTLIVDNSPEWQPYPRRSKSYICTTELHYAKGYGSAYRVYPFDTANIGICTGSDFWYSFPALKQIDIYDIDTFNLELDQILFYLYNQTRRNDTTFDNIKKGCAVVDQVLDSVNYEYNHLTNKLDRQDKIVLKTFTFNKRPMLQGIMDLLSPLKNRFKHAKITQLTSLPNDIEVWTDSPCIFELTNTGKIT